MAIDPHRYLSASDVRLTDCNGEDIGRWISSLTYNPTTSAFELRGPKESPDGSIGPTIPDLTSKSPLHVFAMGRCMALLHFEAVTVMPIEVDLDAVVLVKIEGEPRTRFDRGGVVFERVVLRGARIENIPPTT